MMKKLHLVIWYALLSIFANAQSTETRPYIGHNMFSVEAFGVASWYSANYEHILFNTKNNLLLLSAGGGYYRNFDNMNRWVTIPLKASLAIGKNGHYGEVSYYHLLWYSRYYGVTGNPLKREENYRFFSIGYRFQKFKRGIFFRVYGFPIVSTRKYQSADPSPYLYHLGYDIYAISDELKSKKRVVKIWGGIGIGYAFGRW